MRILLTGGGTGGHTFPNIAIISELQKLDRNNTLELHYIGSKDSIEQKLIARVGIPFHAIAAGKLRRYLSFQNIIDMFKVGGGYLQALWLLRKLKPTLVFAKGGYVSLPVVFAARTLRIPVWIHESDLSPGLATKFASKVAQRIYLSFNETKKFLSSLAQKCAHVVGNPIREAVAKGDAARGKQMMHFTHRKPLLLVMGGSLGARSLNALVIQNLSELSSFLNIVHLTGPHADSNAAAPYQHSYHAFEFLNEELFDLYASCDMILTRAGSGSIFECLAVNKPMLLLPLPKSASRGDQIENAEAFEKKGWARVMDQDTLNSAHFVETLRLFTQDESSRAAMKKTQLSADCLEAASKIAHDIFALS